MTRQQTPDILGAMLDGAAAKPAVTLDYDYALMTEDSATAAIAAAQQIKPRMQSAVEDIIAIGAELRTVKSKIDHGHWLPWVESELQMEPRTAQRFMAVARAYAGKNDTVSYLNLSTVYKLIQAPQSARDEIEAMPEPPTNADARRIIAEHKPAPLTGEVLPPEPDAAGQHTPRGTCRICKRPLTSADSVANGMGDVCAAHAARDADIEDAKANAHAQPQTAHSDAQGYTANGSEVLFDAIERRLRDGDSITITYHNGFTAACDAAHGFDYSVGAALEALENALDEIYHD